MSATGPVGIRRPSTGWPPGSRASSRPGGDSLGRRERGPRVRRGDRVHHGFDRRRRPRATRCGRRPSCAARTASGVPSTATPSGRGQRARPPPPLGARSRAPAPGRHAGRGRLDLLSRADDEFTQRLAWSGPTSGPSNPRTDGMPGLSKSCRGREPSLHDAAGPRHHGPGRATCAVDHLATTRCVIRRDRGQFKAVFGESGAMARMARHRAGEARAPSCSRCGCSTSPCTPGPRPGHPRRDTRPRRSCLRSDPPRHLRRRTPARRLRAAARQDACRRLSPARLLYLSGRRPG